MKTTLILSLCLCFATNLYTQIQWHHKDPEVDSVFGLSTEKARGLLKTAKSTTVVVAVIDSGIDTTHVSLIPALWTDSATGIRGWNYIGQETGREDVTMLVASNKEFYDSISYTVVPEQYRKEYKEHRKVTNALKSKISAMESLLHQLQNNDSKDAEELRRRVRHHLEHGLNITNLEADTAIGDADITPDILAPVPNANQAPYHGTHVAGIIGAVRDKATGYFGVATNVKLLALKVNGNIRELRDKSLGDAIRFAVDHGAKVINISMGKPYSWNKEFVDKAVKYAMSKDVLIVHGAGNDGISIDDADRFPNRHYGGGGQADAWLEVGASDIYGNPALFSNFGANRVDVFAPGVGIYSTIPGNRFASWNGTSMAAPMVSGLATLIWSYYPKLTATQVKEIIMKSVVKRDFLKDKCVSGGIVNAYKALKLAASYK